MNGEVGRWLASQINTEINGYLFDVARAVAAADTNTAPLIVYCGHCTGKQRHALGWIVPCPALEGLLLVASGPSLYFGDNGAPLTPGEFRKATGKTPPPARRGAVLTGPNRLEVRFPDHVPSLEQSTRVKCPIHGEMNLPDTLPAITLNKPRRVTLY